MRYTRLERVVAEACKHHTVIGNRRDTQGPIGGRDSYLQVITAQTEYLDNVRNQVEIRRRRMDCIVTADAPRTQPRSKDPPDARSTSDNSSPPDNLRPSDRAQSNRLNDQ
jgi:hypothetical protein